MVHYDDNLVRGSRTIGRMFRRIAAVACVLAIPGIWMAVQGALPEERVMGLALSVVLVGIAGLCWIERR